MIRFLLLLLFSLAVLLPGQAQRYFNAGGLRFGTDWGLTYQQRLAKHWTAEVILNNERKHNLTMLTVLGERHVPIIGKRLNLYTGAGLHKGFFDANSDILDDERDPFGLTFVGGLEFTIGRLNLSYDIKPAVNIVNAPQAVYWQTGLSARYVIAKNKVWKDMNKNRKKRQKARKKRNGEGFKWKFWE